jgi:ABC-type cobalamin/Fe3+-siderophores transport system ATPase subunit
MSTDKCDKETEVESSMGMFSETSLLSDASHSSTREWQTVDGMQGIITLDSDTDENDDHDDHDDSDEEEEEEEGLDKEKKTEESSHARFNIELLGRCIEDGQPTLRKIEKKHVCLVIGKTGSGKSTLIQGLAGKKFRRAEHVTQIDGRNLTKIVHEAEDPLEGFEIGHDKVSKTHSISCLKLHKTYFIDSPGFEDTGGIEIDTATSVLFRQVAERCKTLRFIFVISFSSLEDARGQPMRAIVKMIKGFVKDFKSKRNSFMFLFSHVPQDGNISANDRLHKEIEDLLQGQNEGEEKVVLEFIKKSLQKKDPHVQIVSPETSDFASLLCDTELSLKRINRKDDLVTDNCGLTLSSQLTLEGEVAQAQLEVKGLFERYHIDSKRIIDIYNTVGLLAEFIGYTRIKEGLDDIRRCIDDFCQNERKVVNQKIDQGTELGSQFSTEDIDQLKNEFQYLIDLAGMTEASLMERIVVRVSNFVASIMKKVDQDDWSTLSDGLGKMQCWAKEFPELFMISYDEVRSAVQKRLTTVEDDVRRESDFDMDSGEEIVSELLNVLASVSSWQRHLSDLTPHGINISGISSSQARLHSSLVNVVTNWKNEVVTTRFSLEDIRRLASRARVLQSCQSILNHREFAELTELVSSCHDDIKLATLIIIIIISMISSYRLDRQLLPMESFKSA